MTAEEAVMMRSVQQHCSQTSGRSQFILLSHAVKQHYHLTVQVTFDPVDIMSMHHVAAALPELKCSLSGPQALCSLPHVTVQCCLAVINVPEINFPKRKQ